MDELLTKMAEMAEVETQFVDTFELEWDCREAVRQANKVSKVFGDPSYTNQSPGGSIHWFDLGKPMPFSEITVEDSPPYGLFYGKKTYSSFTILMRLSKPTIDAPAHIATYNHNNGKLICHAESWKEAVIIAVAVNLRDSGGLQSVSEMCEAWRKTKDVTDFVTFLIGEDEEESIENDDEEDPASPIPILIEKKEVKKTSPPLGIIPPLPATTKPSVKSPAGKARGKARVSSPPRSPVKTIGVPKKSSFPPSLLKK